MKKKFIIFILVLMLAGGVYYYDSITKKDKTNEPIEEEKIDYKKLLVDVIDSKSTYINEENEEVYYRDYKINEQNVIISKYGFVDMDDDGIEEMVCYTTNDFGAVLIFHYENELIYGYMLDLRAIEIVKIDGSFIGSNGALSHVYETISFDKYKYNITVMAVDNRTESIYKIDNQDVIVDEIDAYVDNWNKIKEIEYTSR